MSPRLEVQRQILQTRLQYNQALRSFSYAECPEETCGKITSKPHRFVLVTLCCESRPALSGHPTSSSLRDGCFYEALAAASSRSFLRARFSKSESRRSARSLNCRCSTPVSQ